MVNDVMSKFEILKKYKLLGHPEYIRDTWQNLGGATIIPSSRTFIKDMVYLVLAPTPGTVTTSGDWIPRSLPVNFPVDPFNMPTGDGYGYDNGGLRGTEGIIEEETIDGGVLFPYPIGQSPNEDDNDMERFANEREGPWDGAGGGSWSGRTPDEYFHVNGPALYGSLVICEANLYNSNPLDWGAGIIEDDEEGYLSFVEGIISPHFRLLLTSTELAAAWNIVGNAAYILPDPTFVPYSETTTSTIIIPDEQLEQILVEVGVPFILLEELEFPRNKICDDLIATAMQDYFKYFPIVHRESVYNTIAQAGQIFHVPVPEGAYGAVRVFVNQGTTDASGAAAGNPMHFFASEIAWWGGGSNNNWSPIRYGSGRSPGYSNLQGFGTMALDRAARQGILNYATRCEFHINYNEKTKQRELIGYANRTGTLEIYWAHASNDWNAIEYQRAPEVRKLATARILRALGMLRGQVKSDIPGQINFDMFIQRADKLEEEVMTFWKDPSLRAVLIRGSM